MYKENTNPETTHAINYANKQFLSGDKYQINIKKRSIIFLSTQKPDNLALCIIFVQEILWQDAQDYKSQDSNIKVIDSITDEKYEIQGCRAHF